MNPLFQQQGASAICMTRSINSSRIKLADRIASSDDENLSLADVAPADGLSDVASWRAGSDALGTSRSAH